MLEVGHSGILKHFLKIVLNVPGPFNHPVLIVYSQILEQVPQRLGGASYVPIGQDELRSLHELF